MYAIGLAAVNIYLLPFGVTEFGLVKPSVIYTGVLVLLPVAMTIMVLGLVRHYVDRKLPDRQRRVDQLRRVVVVVVVGALLAWALLTISFYVFAGSAPYKAAADAFKFIIPCVMLAAPTVYYARRRPPSPPPAGDAIQPRRLSSLIVILPGIVILLFYLNRFADDVYPSVPRQLGGGQSFTAQMLFTTEAATKVAQLGLPLDRDSTALSVPVKVIFEGPDFYLLCFNRIAQQSNDPAVVGYPVNLEHPLDCIRQKHLTAVRMDKRFVAAVIFQARGL